MKIIAMIPARLGSKRIPYKNLKLLDEKPLIQYPIDLAKSSYQFDDIFVNTESNEIGEIAIQNNVQFFKRPEELSSDTATNNDFTAHFLENNECDFLVMINSTSPLISPETLNNFILFVREMRFDTVLSVTSIQSEIIFKGKPLNFSYENKINSQNIEPVNSLVWCLSAWKRDTFLKNYNHGKCAVFGGNVGYFQIPKSEAYDIDTEEDWQLVEAQMMRNKMTIMA